MALFYKNSKGETKVVEVGPSINPPGPIPLSRAAVQEHYFSRSQTDSPWGKIAGGERPWWPDDELLPQSVLVQEDDLSPQWNRVREKLARVMKAGYEYQGPFDQNSNTFVRDATEYAHIPAPDGIGTDIEGNIGAYWTPGARHLSNPIQLNQAAMAVPSVVSNNPLAPVSPGAFNDRSGTPSSPIAPPDLNEPQSTGAATPDKIRVLSGRLVVPNGAGVAGSTPVLPNSSLPQSGWPPAIADRRPMPDYPLPPPSVYGLPDRNADNMDDWFNRWIKPLFDK
jgi:hypothetical protein